MESRRQSAELSDAFRQITLTLASIFAVYEADDDLVEVVRTALGDLFDSFLTASKSRSSLESERPVSKTGPHPEMLKLLAQIDRHTEQADAG